MRELRRVPANATSVYLKMAWMDVERSGKLHPSALEDTLPGLSQDDATAVAALSQTIAEMYSAYDAGLAYFHKAIHRTSTVLGASVHTAARTTAMGSVGRTIDEFDPSVRRFAHTHLRIHRASMRSLDWTDSRRCQEYIVRGRALSIGLIAEARISTPFPLSPFRSPRTLQASGSGWPGDSPWRRRKSGMLDSDAERVHCVGRAKSPRGHLLGLSCLRRRRHHTDLSCLSLKPHRTRPEAQIRLRLLSIVAHWPPSDDDHGCVFTRPLRLLRAV